MKHALIFPALIVAALLAAPASLATPVDDEAEKRRHTRLMGTVIQAKQFEAGVVTFRDAYGAFPGDLKVAAHKLPRCQTYCNPEPVTTGDHIVGDLRFMHTLRPQVAADTPQAGDGAAAETVLFWTHLYLADLVDFLDTGALPGGVNDWRRVYPKAPSGGRFIVGHSPGMPLPAHLSRGEQLISGLLAVLVSDEVLEGGEMNASGTQALSPQDAAFIDRRIDDGRPHTGHIRAYGAAACFDGNENAYAPETLRRDCGLVFRLHN